MQRVDTPSAITVKPAQEPAGTPGYFTKGDPAQSVSATVPGQDWFNSIQEELIAILTAAGVTPNKANHAQVLTALISLGLRAATTTEAGVIAVATNIETQSAAAVNKAVTPPALQAKLDVTYTATDVLAKLLTVDGALSGLDADLLDGWHGDDIRARANHTGTQPVSTITGLGALATLNNISGNLLVGDPTGTQYTIQSNDAEKVSTAVSWTKMKEIYVGIKGTYNIYYESHLNNGSGNSQLRVNDVAVGTLRGLTLTYQGFVEDIALNHGDLIQVYTLQTGGANTYVQNFRVRSAGSYEFFNTIV